MRTPLRSVENILFLLNPRPFGAKGYQKGRTNATLKFKILARLNKGCTMEQNMTKKMVDQVTPGDLEISPLTPYLLGGGSIAWSDIQFLGGELGRECNIRCG